MILVSTLEYFPFKPTGTEYNNPGVKQINIENQDQYFLPHQSILLKIIPISD